jgi:hypothetical protein
MSAEALAMLIGRMGIEFAIDYLNRAGKGTITVADLEELRAKYARSREQVIAEATAAVGLPKPGSG